MANNKLIRTLDDLVSYGATSEFSDKKTIFLRNENDIIFADDIVYDKYRNYLFEYRKKRTLTEEEQQRYRYRPDRFAMDVYANPNLGNLVLYTNCCSEAEFATSEYIYYLTDECVNDLLVNILSHETTNISNASKKAYE